LTGDPSDPWLIASAPSLNWAWASSQDSVEVPGRRAPPRPARLLATAGEDPVMGCEGVDAGHDGRTMIGGVVMENDDGRRVNDERGEKSCAAE